MRFQSSLFVAALSLTTVCAQIPAIARPAFDENNIGAHLRLGHAAANAVVPPVTPNLVHPPTPAQGKHRCGGMRGKAIRIFEMIKTIRVIPIRGHKKEEQSNGHHKVHLVGAKHVPRPVVVESITVIDAKVISVPWYKTAEAYPLRKALGHHHHHHPHHQHMHHMHHKQLDEAPFLVRLEHALMQLGKWEGRALSFVIGCGLGALLRMFIVLAVVTVRSVKARRNRRLELAEEYEQLPNEVVFVVEEYPVEKAPITADKA